METTFTLRIILYLVFIALLTLIGSGRGLVCESYDQNKCDKETDKTARACRAISEFCDVPTVDYHCWAFWEETPEGQAVILFKGCYHSDKECDAKKCSNLRRDTLHRSFCCCTGDNCNTQVLPYGGQPRAKDFVETLSHDYIRPASNGTTSVSPLTMTASTEKMTEPVTGALAETTGQTLTSAPMSVTTKALVAVTVSVCVVVVALTAFFLYRFLRLQIRGGKKAPFDLEAQVMAPLMSKEYENQDGCVLLKNLVLGDLKATGRYGLVFQAKLGEVDVAVKITQATEMATWKNEVHIYHKFLMPNPHPNILRFMLSGHRPSEGRMFLVTEYHPLGSLVDLLKGRSITNAEAERIMCTMLAGLAFLHDSDGKPAIAHRDFKSTNVLIKSDMSACIADFGLATAFESDERIGDKHGQVGTRRYMAPELLEGAISLNVVSFLRVDVFACGMVLWEILTRTQLTPDLIIGVFKLPLEEELGTAPTNEVVQMAVVQKRQRPAFKPAWKTTPRNLSLCLTIEECWDADPEARPSASCLLNRLRQLSTTGSAITPDNEPAAASRQG